MKPWHFFRAGPGTFRTVRWRTDDAPAYRLEVLRSHAGSFMDRLTAGATEFGLEVLPAGRS
jgi:sarcosine oxidase gamma subunit